MPKSITSQWKLVAVAIALSLVFLFIHLSSSASSSGHHPSGAKMGVTHVVLFQFKQSASAEEINDVLSTALYLAMQTISTNLASSDLPTHALSEGWVHPSPV